MFNLFGRIPPANLPFLRIGALMLYEQQAEQARRKAADQEDKAQQSEWDRDDEAYERARRRRASRGAMTKS